MSVILLLILASLAIAGLFLGGFIWAVKAGQFEDPVTPPLRLLFDEPETRPGDRRASGGHRPPRQPVPVFEAGASAAPPSGLVSIHKRNGAANTSTWDPSALNP